MEEPTPERGRPEDKQPEGERAPGDAAPNQRPPFNAMPGDMGPRRRRGGRGRGRRGVESNQTRDVARYEQRQQQPPPRGFRPQWRREGRPPPQQYQQRLRQVTGGPPTAVPEGNVEPIAGTHAVLEALRSGRFLRALYVAEDRSVRSGPVQDVINEAQARRVRVNFVDKLDLSRLAPVESHQGVVGIFEARAGVDLDELLVHLDALREPALVLVVDSLQDPQNFGVLLRTAEGAGVHGVVMPRHRAVGVTGAVAKTSAGASEHLLIADVANIRQAVDELKRKGVWVVGTAGDGDLYYDEVDYRGPTAIVVGGEAEGMRRLVREACDQVVRIPLRGRVESLNAAAAGSIVLYEALRQRVRDAAPAPRRAIEAPPSNGEAAQQPEEAES